MQVLCLRKSLTLFLILTLLLVSGCSDHRPAPIKDINQKGQSSKPLSVQNKYRPNYIVVNKGDTLYTLGFKHQIDFKTLAKINNIKPPYRIYPGQKLFFKAKKAPKSQNVTVSKINKKRPITEQKPSQKTIKKPAPQKPIAKKPVSKKATTTAKVNKPIAKTPPRPKPKPVQAPSSNSKWIWPIKGKVIRTFSSKQVSRKGIDISAKQSSPVYATNNGKVVYSGNGLLGYGELIIVKHSDSLLSAYAHNSKRLVNEGETVNQGQQIASSGKDSEGKELLHFEIRKKGKPVDPLLYLPKR